MSLGCVFAVAAAARPPDDRMSRSFSSAQSESSRKSGSPPRMRYLMDFWARMDGVFVSLVPQTRKTHTHLMLSLPSSPAVTSARGSRAADDPASLWVVVDDRNSGVRVEDERRRASLMHHSLPVSRLVPRLEERECNHPLLLHHPPHDEPLFFWCPLFTRDHYLIYCMHPFICCV